MLQTNIFINAVYIPNQSADTVEAKRIRLTSNELYRLPQTAFEIRILSGAGWLTFDSSDVVMKPGESYQDNGAGLYNAFISALGGSPVEFLVIEL